MKIKFLLSVLPFILFVPACKKKNNDPMPVDPNSGSNTPTSLSCKITKVISNTDSLILNISEDKLTHLGFYDKATGAFIDSMVYTYSGNEVTINNYEQTGIAGRSRKVTLGSNGLAISETGIDNQQTYISYDTITYEYNSDGYLIKSIRMKTNKYISPEHTTKSTTEYIYTIINGNTTKWISKNGNYIDSTTFQFYPELENKSILYTWEPIHQQAFYGKPNKNLIKTVKYPHIVEDYSYHLNDQGYVTETKLVDKEGSNTFKYGYLCK